MNGKHRSGRGAEGRWAEALAYGVGGLQHDRTPCNPRHAVMMKKALVFALVAVACAACRPPSGERAESSTESASTRSAAEGAGPGRFASAAGRVSFASLPDRGDLLAYPRPTPARQTGAYTWHRAELSEAHAFQSLQSGSLRVTSPSGQPLEYEYVRHVEHPSGDWTWIGRLKGGAPSDEAVITFGERAAFGSIAEPGKPPLRVTTSAGAAWIVETDPVKVAAIDNEATRPSRPDYLLPPEQAASLAAADTSATAASAPSTSAAGAAAATTVDVVVGYTAGFASALGGTSQAVTRLNNMVETTNQAYANSQVDAAIRMVHALQVSYPDNTANGATLESLTGYRSGTGQIPVDPAFSALRAARDQYGGDLVTLVRRFQTPENDGCGIAWLIGGDQTGIDTGDAPFGYSVVSDGTDVDTDGKTYFCREETLAHELGHNMGSQHDRTSATENGQLKYGVFAYSFGYKSTATAGNFYTVMAYGDSGQVSYRVFSNPSITFCGGLVCGVAEQADNARSLRQTTPVVALFRTAQVVNPTPKRDIVALAKNGLSGRTEVHQLTFSSGYQSYSKHIATALSRTGSDHLWVLLLGDYNRDGVEDIYAINKVGASGRTEVHVLNGADSFRTYLAHIATALGVTGRDEKWVFELADYNRDGTLDLYGILRQGSSGRTEVHVLNGANRFSGYLVNVATPLPATGSDGSWDFGLGDQNRDGAVDLFAISKMGRGSGRTEIVVLDGASSFRTYLGEAVTALGQTGRDGAWQFRISDYNGDQVLDAFAILRNGSSGRTELHVLNGSSNFSSFLLHRATALGRTGSDGSWNFDLAQ